MKLYIKENQEPRRWIDFEEEPPITMKLKHFLTDNSIKYETDNLGKTTQFSVYVTESELKMISDFIDSIPFSAIREAICTKPKEYRHQYRDNYIVEKRKYITDYTNRVVDRIIKTGTIPTIDSIASKIYNDFETFSYEEALALNNSGIEVLSVYDMAKNIQNLCSFNLDELDEDIDTDSEKKEYSVCYLDGDDPSEQVEIFEGTEDELRDYCSDLEEDGNTITIVQNFTDDGEPVVEI